MSDGLRRDTLFVALTRPQMFAGVTFTFFVINLIVSAELFLIFRSLWVLLAALVLHGVGMLFCLHEPRFFDLWITRVRNCPRVKNFRMWRCNSYRP
ncbi:type IV secretion system protein VirB3 [Pontixanthobacter aquaemixtae]|uniref:Type VI secretion protein n=1 Tax=Pontixanthobacter aquaemixtae TaxID=1958940 RepID=A0A844ZTU0_9SPHN|nr:VirB3 family type IV secretion system protein [Pontixanthobacter aquaemixtae]MXO90884.1 type VI secretion protein [Pontixanthobacter aquaemixtae]